MMRCEVGNTHPMQEIHEAINQNWVQVPEVCRSPRWVPQYQCNGMGCTQAVSAALDQDLGTKDRRTVRLGERISEQP
jgi:hypothetical protein